MRFDIVHCHGSGNDFPLIDARALTLADEQWSAVSRALADRGGPVGGDGLLLLTGGDDAHPFGMRMFNSDGSEAEQCLNGLRCVARAGFAALGIERARVRLQTSSAEAWRESEIAPGVYSVGERAGPAGLDAARWPLRSAARARVVEAAIPELGSERLFTAVAMPNPHLICFVDEVGEAELLGLWERCEAGPDWLPNRANVSFVEAGGDTLFVRTAERGVGLTDSCGSAMAASVFAACLTGRAAWGAALTVRNRGGRVTGAAGEDGFVTLAGNATWEWAGSVEVDLAAARASGLEVRAGFADEAAAWARARGGVD